MILSSTAKLFTILTALPSSYVHGHSFMKEPKSRNFVSNQIGATYNTETPGVPLREYTPQGLNSNTNVCGKEGGSIDYDLWLDMQGNPMPWESQATYTIGQEIRVDTLVTAHHFGHFEVKACGNGRDSTQACFDANPLEFVEDVAYGMPKDEIYTGRAMLHGDGVEFSYTFKLPDNIAGSKVLLQFVYWTANTCKYNGYDEYFMNYETPTSVKGNWNPMISECGPQENIPMIREGTVISEIFVNCAEVSIAGEATPTPPVLPTPPSPTSAPIVQSPVNIPTLAPFELPEVNPDVTGTCGMGQRNNGICPSQVLCCSRFGYCGTVQTGHCDGTPLPDDTPPSTDPVVDPINTPVVSQPADPITPVVTPKICGGTQQGVCPISDMCCSEYGYCGYGTTYCGGTQPFVPDITPPTDPVGVDQIIIVNPVVVEERNENSRLIAYVGNWQKCPTAQQMAQYTHIVIAFAVSYTYSPGENICSETCEIAKPPVCDNADQPELIQEWKDAGKKVILSFGGAGMGGSWAGDQNDCWDYCFGKEDKVVNRLTDIVNEMELDGVDIDYEYFYEDGQNGSTFNKGAEAQTFLKDVTVGLRKKLPKGSELTHAPMEPDMEPGTAYFKVLKQVANKLDFLMPQYYNGFIRPYTNFQEALDHYTDITNKMFDGDATKVVFGFCVTDCGEQDQNGFNLDGNQSAEVMEMLADTYPCNGGAFFWVANSDINGEWSIPVTEQLQIDDNNNGGECSLQEDEEEIVVEEEDIDVDVDVDADIVAVVCENKKKSKFYKKNGRKNCKWIAKKVKQKGKKFCNNTHKKEKLSVYCAKACKVC